MTKRTRHSERQDAFERKGSMRRMVDPVTVICFMAAALLVARPSSLLRASLESFVQDRRTVMAARGQWGNLEGVGARLSNERPGVELIVISDYECPFCRASQTAIDSVVAAGARVAVLHYPLASHPHAEAAARAALCAARDGRFPSLHTRLMTTAEWRKDESWQREASAAGVSDMKRFAACVSGNEVRRELAEHMALSESLMVRATPTFVSRRGVHRGTATVAQIVRLLDER